MVMAAVVAVVMAVALRGIMERHCTGMNSTLEQNQEWFPWGKGQDRSMHQESRNQRERQIGSISQWRSRTTRMHSARTQYHYLLGRCTFDLHWQHLNKLGKSDICWSCSNTHSCRQEV